MISKLRRVAGCVLIIVPIALAGLEESAAQEPAGLGTVEVRAGWVHHVMPGGYGPGGRLSVQIGLPSNSRGRFLGGVSYARAAESVLCCGPNPGYTYQLQSLAVEVGHERELFGIAGASLALDMRYTPILYQELRRGHQEDFQPSPTGWQSAWVAGSMGLTARHPVGKGYQALLGARADFDLGGAVLAIFPTPLLGLSVGLAY